MSRIPHLSGNCLYSTFDIRMDRDRKICREEHSSSGQLRIFRM